jgi:hypothetical protein
MIRLSDDVGITYPPQALLLSQQGFRKRIFLFIKIFMPNPDVGLLNKTPTASYPQTSYFFFNEHLLCLTV